MAAITVQELVNNTACDVSNYLDLLFLIYDS